MQRRVRRNHDNLPPETLSPAKAVADRMHAKMDESKTNLTITPLDKQVVLNCSNTLWVNSVARVFSRFVGLDTECRYACWLM